MPCYEGPRPEDLKRGYEMRGAFPALLCGMHKGDEQATSYARRWCEAHDLVDAERLVAPYSSQLYELQKASDDVLIAYNYARGAVQPCVHRGRPRGGGMCQDCGDVGY